MTILERNHSKKDNSEKETSDKGQPWEGIIKQRTHMNRTNLNNYISEKENLKTNNSAKRHLKKDKSE